MGACIWCLKEGGTPSVEHIIPEALGCPEGLVLPDGTVCRSCNNSLAHLDQAVIGEFDVAAFFARVPRKRGRPPAIKTRGNFVATVEADGPTISVNMDGKASYSHDGGVLGPYGKSDRNVSATLEENGNLAKLNFSITVGGNPKFARGITKIAFAAFARFLGPELAVASTFEPVRDFVRKGIGRRPILMTACKNTGYANQIWSPYVSEHGEYVIAVRLAFAEFVVDLSPTLSASTEFRKMLPALYGSEGWTWLPLDSDAA